MGWWSTDILGGDSPLDWEDEFYAIAGIDKFPKAGGMNEIPKEILESRQQEFSDLCESADYEGELGFQVLAVMMMRVGAKIDNVIKERMIQAAYADEWAGENWEREETMQGLISALKQYDNVTPIVIKSRGLFEVMSEKLNGGKNKS